MLKDSYNQLKNYSLYETLNTGTYLDLNDDGDWKVAEVVNISKYGLRTIVHVRIDGYSTFYNAVTYPSIQKI